VIPTDAVIRLLRDDEGSIFRALRLEALTVEAATFASDAGVEAARPASWFDDRVAEGVIGAFVGCELVGMAGYARQPNPKQAHKATLYGMYLRASHRGSGLSARLVAAVADHARAAGCERLLLACNAGNHVAVRLYESAGFRHYGTEPRALKQADGSYADDALYALDLG
jgi:RimJ/RimL family protein N-acetyltransferase